jgi:periplasmic divalent cation tolerance protein
MAAIVVLSTFPDPEKAADVARTLVSEQLCACVNVHGAAVRSIYRWKGEICDERETLAIFKTTTERFEAMKERLVGLHPYEVPEVIAVPVDGGHAPYLAWLAAETRSD